jgi:hypothetical protein
MYDISCSYKRFLNYFSLCQRERLEGLDASYFENMTGDEREMAFTYLMRGFGKSEENIRGLYLCDKSKAIQLFTKTIDQPIPKGKFRREEEAFLMGRVLMAGYICNDRPSADNINLLIKIDVSAGNKDVRSAFYRSIPSEPTTKAAISRLENAVREETERPPLATAIQKLMACYGLIFNIHDQDYKRIYRGLASSIENEKQSHMDELKKLGSLVYAK